MEIPLRQEEKCLGCFFDQQIQVLREKGPEKLQAILAQAENSKPEIVKRAAKMIKENPDNKRIIPFLLIIPENFIPIKEQMRMITGQKEIPFVFEDVSTSHENGIKCIFNIEDGTSSCNRTLIKTLESLDQNRRTLSLCECIALVLQGNVRHNVIAGQITTDDDPLTVPAITLGENGCQIRRFSVFNHGENYGTPSCGK